MSGARWAWNKTYQTKAKHRLTQQPSRANRKCLIKENSETARSKNSKVQTNSRVTFSNIRGRLCETSAWASLIWSQMHLKCVLQHRLSAVRSNALSHRRAPGSNSRGSSTEHRLSLLHFHSLHYTANSWRPRGRSWVFTCVCVCVCVCAWVLREGFGPNWHRHVKCSREPSWHSCTSKSPRSRQTERRMNANKSADPWVTFSIPALQAMRMETGGLEGYKISLLKWTYKKKNTLTGT